MTARPTISVSLITYNEEENVRDCLESVKWADEIVVVDSLSTDRTVEIARGYTDHIFQRPWPGINAQKSFALQQTTGEWFLNVDADERVPPELAREIQEVVRLADRPEAGFTMRRKTWYLGRWITHGGWYPDRKLRLARRGKARYGGVDPHDHLYVDGPVGELRADLHHYTYRDLGDHARRMDQYATVAAQELLRRGARRPLAGMLLHPPARFLKMYLLRLGFLDGAPGLMVAAMTSYYVFLKYARLWELMQAGKKSP